ncbi:hypothetical protein ANN_26811 [Periplaneta americana]|uniref:PHD-type domain-containing protein n=1 Tax=Periplaneta americana TaxID=6978 RepID=A0ABQ8RZC2_PERAM|nr:hypothetical protein ANN_26811 [Periplaneta americana]
MTDESTQHASKRDESGRNDICPICERKVEDEQAVKCDGTCRKWHHMACADIQKGQLKALKETSKKKSKLMWLCYDCEQDFLMFKAGKSMQKDLEALRADIN